MISLERGRNTRPQIKPNYSSKVHFNRPQSSNKPSTAKRQQGHSTTNYNGSNEEPRISSKRPTKSTLDSSTKVAEPSAKSIDDYHVTYERRPKKPTSSSRVRRSASASGENRKSLELQAKQLVKGFRESKTPTDKEPWIPAPSRTTKGVKSANTSLDFTPVRDTNDVKTAVELAADAAAKAAMNERERSPQTKRKSKKPTDSNPCRNSHEPDNNPDRDQKKEERDIESLMDEVRQLREKVEVEKRNLKSSERPHIDNPNSYSDVTPLTTTRTEVTTADSMTPRNAAVKDSANSSASQTPRFLRIAAGRGEPISPHEIPLSKALFDTELASETACKAAELFLDRLERGASETHQIGASCQVIDSLSYLQNACNRLGRELMLYETERQTKDRHQDEERRQTGEQRERIIARLNLQLHEKDLEIQDLKHKLILQTDDSSKKGKLQESLETVKGHLQKQLRQKESEISRMSVQLKTLESHLAQAKLDQEHLANMVNEAGEKFNAEKEILKKAAKAHKDRAAKAEALADQLSQRLQNKDVETTSESSPSSNTQQLLLKRENDRLQKENKDLTSRLEALVSRTEQVVPEVAIPLGDETAKPHPQPRHRNSSTHLDRESNLTARSDHSSSRGHNNESTQNRDEIIKENLKLRDHISRTENHVDKLEDENKRLQEKLQHIHDGMQNKESDDKELVKLRDRLNESEKRYKELSDRYMDTDRRLHSLDTENKDLNRKLIVLEESSKRTNQTTGRFSGQGDLSLQTRTADLEHQLKSLKGEVAKARAEKEASDRRSEARLSEMKRLLEQSESSGRSMQSYVQFLKKSYANTFGEASMGQVAEFA